MGFFYGKSEKNRIEAAINDNKLTKTGKMLKILQSVYEKVVKYSLCFFITFSYAGSILIIKLRKDGNDLQKGKKSSKNKKRRC